MRLLTLLSFLAMFSIGLQAQEFYGKAVYHTAASLDIKLDSNNTSQDQQDQIQSFLRKAMQKDYELFFDRSTSLYMEQESLDAQGGAGFKMLSSLSGGGGSLFKNVKTKELIKQTEFFSKQFLITDTLENFEWKLENDTKQIGAYTCFKAVAKIKALEQSLSLGNKEGEEMQQDSTEITVTAWYTPQIPISTGPEEYYGLPGLILEINDGTMQMLCTKIVLNPKEKTEIKKPTEGEKVTAAEYEETVKKKLKQMEEMYGGEMRKQGGNSSIKIKMR